MSSSLHGKTPAFQILAHRGLITEDSPHENTIAAFQAALAAGADIIETDVRATSDGIALVFHDADLSRFTGQKTRIGRQPFSILKSHLGAVGVQLHSLEEVLLTFPSARFNIDVKDFQAASAVAEVINRHSAADRVLITSFRKRRRAAALRSISNPVESSASATELLVIYLLIKLRLGRLLPVFFGSLTALQIPRSSGPLRFDSAGFIRAVQQAGLEVHYWTINSPDEMNELLDLGANGLVTDRCDLAVNIRQNRL